MPCLGALETSTAITAAESAILVHLEAHMFDTDLNAAAQAIRGPTCVASAASDDATAEPNAESALAWGF